MGSWENPVLPLNCDHSIAFKLQNTSESVWQSYHEYRDTTLLCMLVLSDNFWPSPTLSSKLLAPKLLPLPHWHKHLWRVAFWFLSPSVCSHWHPVRVNQKAGKVKQPALCFFFTRLIQGAYSGLFLSVLWKVIVSVSTANHVVRIGKESYSLLQNPRLILM